MTDFGLLSCVTRFGVAIAEFLAQTAVLTARRKIMHALKVWTVVISICASIAGMGATCERVEANFQHFDSILAEKKFQFEKTMAAPQDKIWVKSKLSYMVDVDQNIRVAALDWPTLKKYDTAEKECFWKAIFPVWQKIDSANTADLAHLMARYRWITIPVFGKMASEDAWLLAQHADHDRDFQRRVLAILEALHPAGDVSPRNYAYLYDRVTWYADKKPQRFATQGRCVGPSDWQPWDTEDFANVDTRRAALGMESWKDNKRLVDAYCH